MLSAAPAVFCMHRVCACQTARQVQPGLFDRLDISTDTQMSTDMPCISCRSCRSDAAVLCHLPVVVFAVCTGFVHNTAARQVQPGLFDRLDTSQQIHRCLLICLASQVMQVGCCCPLPVVVFIAVHRVCATCHCSQAGSLVSLTDLTHPNRCTDVYWYALNRAGVQVPCSCLLLSAGCCAVAACTGFVQHVNTGRLQGLLHRSNTSKRAREL
jgi:hypothetical protein